MNGLDENSSLFGQCVPFFIDLLSNLCFLSRKFLALDLDGSPRQVLSLGAGFDTSYWVLKAELAFSVRLFFPSPFYYF
jgi:hypothetical protein